jgi:hypothetical protein
LLWLAAQTYLLCLVSFIAGAAVTALVLRRSKPAAEPTEAVEATEATPEPELVPVKATKKSMRYHTPESPYYSRIKDDLVFTSVEAAEEAGFTAWNTKTPATT